MTSPAAAQEQSIAIQLLCLSPPGRSPLRQVVGEQHRPVARRYYNVLQEYSNSRDTIGAVVLHRKFSHHDGRLQACAVHLNLPQGPLQAPESQSAHPNLRKCASSRSTSQSLSRSLEREQTPGGSRACVVAIFLIPQCPSFSLSVDVTPRLRHI